MSYTMTGVVTQLVKVSILPKSRHLIKYGSEFADWRR